MDAFTGEVRIFAGTFAPRDWFDCNGQLLPISQYSVLFTILGTTYGGDGQTTFALPNLNGCVPMHQGAGSGLTPRLLGSSGGEAAVTLDMTQIPSHQHVPQALDIPGSSKVPNDAIWARSPKAGRPTPVDTKNFDPTLDAPMSPLAVGVSGGSQAHNNMQPYVATRFIICAYGNYPSRG